MRVPHSLNLNKIRSPIKFMNVTLNLNNIFTSFCFNGIKNTLFCEIFKYPSITVHVGLCLVTDGRTNE